MKSGNQEFIRGTLKTIVLQLLAQQGRMYGYEITQAVEERTAGELTLTFGALYPVLHKLVEEGLLITHTQEVDGRLRKYYQLTPVGSETAIEKLGEFDRFVQLMRLILNPAPTASLGQ
ncbi:transcriptional regulator, PadR-like family [Fibrella aestuarina BUZ 2]|uniref:Transcriptional regulator, PadR-like family n=1 Tax=Fibrella aestuarina BUZ 2 TaxID=1166018 RepID=I0K2P3_9BACT|nr:PadR family transcriptional regulator [Fibrella aestuarina]CCG98396.1 transcriptional regulator, PadR-like family [Fibrella aestuarina BUZ 2]